MATQQQRPVDEVGEFLWQELNETRGTRADFREWAEKVPEPKTGPLNFDRFPYQAELYSQHSAEDRELVIKKATQVGVSTYLLRWILYHVDTRGLTGLYLFPTERLMYDFSDARIKPAIEGSEYLSGRIAPGDVQNKGLKRIGRGFMYCRGSESKMGLQSVDADLLAMDEYEELRPEHIPDAERRMGSSPYKLLRRVGVPDLPGRGLDLLYEQSDKRQWLVGCGCGEHQALTYDENVDEADAILRCRKCRKPLDVKQGEWVPEHPDREVRGYHLSRLLVPGENLRPIIKAHHETTEAELRTHFTKDLGLAYAPSEGRLALDRIKAAQRPDIRIDERGQEWTAELVTMGVDVATKRALNVRISGFDGQGRKRNLFLGLAENFGAVTRLFQEFNVNICCIDHLPEGRLARGFADRFPGRVFLVNYASNQKVVLAYDPQLMTVSVRRVEAIDATLDMIRTQMNLLPEELPEHYIRDLQNVIRTVSTDEKTGKSTVGYQELGPTDWLQSEVYDTVAYDLWLAIRATEQGFEGEVGQMEDVERSQLNWEEANDEGFAGSGESEGDSSMEYDPGFE